MAMQRPGPFVTGRIRLARPEIRLFVPADTALRTGASYAPDHRRPLPFVDKQETTMTTKNRLFALAAATFTASLVAGTASARPPIPSANAINKVHTLSTHVPFVVRPTNPGGNGRKDNNGSDNSTVRN